MKMITEYGKVHQQIKRVGNYIVMKAEEKVEKVMCHHVDDLAKRLQ